MTYKQIIVAILLAFGILTHFSVSGVMVTCDLDLPEEVYKYLPEECMKLNGAEKMLAIEESSLFDQWHKNINDYEDSKSQPIDGEIPEKQWQLRENITANSLIWQCQTSTTYYSYYGCLKDARLSMINMLEQYKQQEG